MLHIILSSLWSQHKTSSTYLLFPNSIRLFLNYDLRTKKRQIVHSFSLLLFVCSASTRSTTSTTESLSTCSRESKTSPQFSLSKVCTFVFFPEIQFNNLSKFSDIVDPGDLTLAHLGVLADLHGYYEEAVELLEAAQNTVADIHLKRVKMCVL